MEPAYPVCVDANVIAGNRIFKKVQIFLQRKDRNRFLSNMKIYRQDSACLMNALNILGFWKCGVKMHHIFLMKVSNLYFYNL